MFYRDFKTDSAEAGNIGLENDFGYGATIGIDVGSSPRWTFSTAATYLETEAQPDVGGSSLDVNPWILSLGVGAKF